ncbi:unnamed protein product, partial [Mesorhabditis belari]|uniref:IgGFc-binding protein N-terminal domain-containing protein n=1 Tax=Mesorhabditis belari TaxID=2138241 RepID=A0AAF3J3C5_9BILA
MREFLKLYAFFSLFYVVQSFNQRGNLLLHEEPAKAHPVIRAFTTGTTFIFAIPNSHIGVNDTSYTEEITLIVTNYDTVNPATVTVSTPSAVFKTTTFTIAPLQNYRFSVPAEIQVGYKREPKNEWFYSSQSIYLTADTKVSLVAQNLASDSISGGMFVVYPTCTLGQSYRTVGDDTSRFPVRNDWSIIATQDNTAITVNPPLFGQTSFSLNAGQILVFSSNDFSNVNTQIIGNFPIAMVVGTACGLGYYSNKLCNYEASMLFPVPAGTAFPFTQFISEDPGEGQLLILAQDNDTLVFSNGRAISTLDAFGYASFLVTDVYITTNKPVYAFAFSSMRQDGQGSPFLVHIPAVSQFTNQSYIQVTTGLKSKQGWAEQHFIRLETEMTATQSKSKLSIDGSPVSPSLFQRQGTSNIYMVDYPISPGTHTIETIDPAVKYAAIVYGFMQFIAYAYTPGIDLPTFGNC